MLKVTHVVLKNDLSNLDEKKDEEKKRERLKRRKNMPWTRATLSADFSGMTGRIHRRKRSLNL